MAGLYYDPRTKQYSTIDEKRPEQQIVQTVAPTSEQRAATPSYANANTQVNAGGVRQPIRTDTPENTVQDAMQRIADYGQFTAPYQAQQDAKIAAMMGRQPFSYDYATDPAWQAYKKEYVREGRRATEDTLGQYAAMTGGMPSTAAMTAASQAGDYYNAKLTDKIPELYRLAYDMYSDEANRTMSELSALRSLNNDDYGRWSDAYGRLGDLYTIGSKERAYADAERERQAKADAAKLYAYGDGDPYEIGSGKGQYFVLNAAPGDSMTGGDGSAWRKNGDGSVIITRGGQTWRIAAPAATASYGKGKLTADGDEEFIDYDSDRGKSLVKASNGNPALASQYLTTYWDNMGYEERFSLLQNMGYDNQTAMALARGNGLTGADFGAYLKSTAQSPDTLMEYIKENINSQKDAVNYLQNNGVMAQPLTQEQWAMSAEKSRFKTYSDYLKAFVYDYMGG